MPVSGVVVSQGEGSFVVVLESHVIQAVLYPIANLCILPNFLMLTRLPASSILTAALLVLRLLMRMVLPVPSSIQSCCLLEGGGAICCLQG